MQREAKIPLDGVEQNDESTKQCFVKSTGLTKGLFCGKLIV